MKKTYSKPEIFFEDFSLSTSITAGCDIDHGTQAKDQCGYYFGRDGMIFTEDVSGCRYKKPDGYNEMCYHVPVEDQALFNS